MTKTVYNTDLKEVKTVRLVCENCGAAYEMPVNDAMPVPSHCYLCKKQFSVNVVSGMTQLLEGLSTYRHSVTNKGGIIEIETDKTD